MAEPEAVPDLPRRVEEWTREHVGTESVEEADQIGKEVAEVVGPVVAETSIWTARQVPDHGYKEIRWESAHHTGQADAVSPEGDRLKVTYEVAGNR